MAITSETSSIEYSGNGSTVTAYPVPFRFVQASHLTVTVTASGGAVTILAPTTGFVASGAGDESGSIRTVAAVPGSSTLRIERSVPFTQPNVYSVGGALPPKTLEQNFDLIVMQVQRAWRSIVALTAKFDLLDPLAWANITDKPTTFAPGGGAGGVLSGSYPNPGFAVDMVTQAELDTVAAAKADTSHTHDNRYYTETEMDTALASRPLPLIRSEPPVNGELPFVTGTPTVILSGSNLFVSGILTPSGANGTYTPDGTTGSLDKPNYSKAGGYSIVSQFYGDSPQPSLWVFRSPSGRPFPAPSSYVIFKSGLNDSNSTPADASSWFDNNFSIPPIVGTGTAATALGQLAIVDESSVYACARLLPVKWVQLSN